jgi:NAD(P)-dependent dehydrogenase (short-subunit alcohol dehydrogenase family)
MKGFDVKVRGSLILGQALLAHVARKPALIIVSTAGAHTLTLHPGMGSYIVSKLAATRMVEYFALGNSACRDRDSASGNIGYSYE